MIELLIWTGLFALTALITWLGLRARRQPVRAGMGSDYEPTNTLPGKAGSPRQKSQGSRQLWNRLMTLLNGDRRAAERLLESARKANPGRSEDWYLDKVIYDLRRDRRC